MSWIDKILMFGQQFDWPIKSKLYDVANGRNGPDDLVEFLLNNIKERDSDIEEQESNHQYKVENLESEISDLEWRVRSKDSEITRLNKELQSEKQIHEELTKEAGNLIIILDEFLKWIEEPRPLDFRSSQSRNLDYWNEVIKNKSKWIKSYLGSSNEHNKSRQEING